MLRITIPGSSEGWDEVTETFVPGCKEQTLSLEHSLVSISKWESKWHKPFISEEPKTNEETIDYIRCMNKTQNIDPSVFLRLSNENIKAVNDYIDDPMTATTIYEHKKSQESTSHMKNKNTITSERIYYWMIAYGIPFECQKWHLSRLLTLIKVCQVETDSKSNKMSKKDILNNNRELNEARRKMMRTKG